MESAIIGNGIRVNGRDYEIIGVTAGDTYSSGGPSVFEVFDTTDYEYLEINRGSARGNEIINSYSATGIFKLRSGFNRGQNAETYEQGATLHIRPTEEFLSNVPSNREHYRVVLSPTKFVEVTS